jgi:hypothetical protein
MVGQRFSDHTIPLEFLRDLSALEEMVIEVAKWRFIEEHPDRKRIPRGFTDGVSLKLSGIREGSAVPSIVLSTPRDGLFPSQNIRYFEEARDCIISAIDAAEHDGAVTHHLPRKLLGYFDKMGRGLREDEAIEFTPPGNGRVAHLTKPIRRRLLEASDAEDRTEEVSLRGSVPEADQERKSFQLHVIGGPRVGAPLEPQHLPTVLEAFAGYNQGVHVLLQGIGRYNRQNRLQKVDSVEHINVLDPCDVASRLEELKELGEGWLDGHGVAPSREGIDWLAQRFDKSYSDELPVPYLYPTAEGGVQAEWSLGSHEVSLTIDLATHQAQWHAVAVATEQVEVQGLMLDEVSAWDWLQSQLIALGGDQ